jgi:predicted transcriptional regulator
MAWRRGEAKKLVMQKAAFCQTVAAIVRDMKAEGRDVSPDTVRAVIRRAADHGDIVLTRFRMGRSSRAIKVIERDPAVFGLLEMEKIFFGKR